MGVTTTLRPVEHSGKDKRVPEPCIFVVFGASGDLTKRKLLPALFHLRQPGLLPEEFAVVGVARRDLSETFVPDMKNGIFKGGGVAETDPRLDSFLDRVKYFQTNFDDDDGFERLKHYLAELDEELGTRGNRLFYLAVAPEYFADIIARLGAHGMAQSGEEADNWVRVVIEKPFGTDLASAKKLNDDVNAVFSRIRYSDRSLSRQRNGAEHSVLSFRQWNLRADLESELRRAGRDYHCGNGGCRVTGTIL